MENTIIIPSDCPIGFLPHEEHGWYRSMFSLKATVCPGVPDRYMYRTAAEEHHKHRMILTQWRWSGAAPGGIKDYICVLVFTCKDKNCNYEYELYRWQYDKLTLRDPGKKPRPWR